MCWTTQILAEMRARKAQSDTLLHGQLDELRTQITRMEHVKKAREEAERRAQEAEKERKKAELLSIESKKESDEDMRHYELAKAKLMRTRSHTTARHGDVKRMRQKVAKRSAELQYELSELQRVRGLINVITAQNSGVEVEEHHEAYPYWLDSGVRGAVLVHVRARRACQHQVFRRCEHESNGRQLRPPSPD